jgi:hypothetical protein
MFPRWPAFSISSSHISDDVIASISISEKSPSEVVLWRRRRVQLRYWQILYVCVHEESSENMTVLCRVSDRVPASPGSEGDKQATRMKDLAIGRMRVSGIFRDAIAMDVI